MRRISSPGRRGAEGKLGDCWVSRDLGATWEQISHPALGAEWPRRADCAALCHGGSGSMLILGGLNSSGTSRSMGRALADVWRSDNTGQSWGKLDTSVILRKKPPGAVSAAAVARRAARPGSAN